MKRKMKITGWMLLIMVFSILTFSMAAFAAEVPKIKIPVNVEVSGRTPGTAENFNVVLKAKDAENPMPQGSVDGVYTAVVSGGSTGYLEVDFPELGIYKYTIHQEPGTNSRGNYDDTVYNLTVYVTNAETDGLETTTILYIDDINTKHGSADFSNHYRGGGGGSDSKLDPDPDPKPTTPATETITDGETPLSDGGFVQEIIDDLIPLAVLPATGTLWWFVAVLVAAGAVMFIVGFYRNRKDSKDEE